MRARIGFLASLALLLATLPAAGAGASGPGSTGSDWAVDPVRVYYPKSDCRGDRVELEVWDREDRLWRDHPVHPQVPVQSCQVEDAGYLFNEIRWRCVEPFRADQPAPNWVVGLDVFDPDVMETCDPGQIAQPRGDLQLHVESPAPGERVAEPEMSVAVEGSVRMDGIDGTDYDVLVVIDRSQATRPRDAGDVDRLAAQVDAARRLVEQLAPRLGPVRVGIASFPNMPPLPDSPAGTAARREIALTDDAAALGAALDGVARRGASGFQTFGSALDFALSELEGKVRGSRARQKARKVLVMAADASDAPFGRAATSDAGARARLRSQLERADRGHVVPWFFALGGVAEEIDPELESLLEVADARYQRVLRPHLPTPFLGRVQLPRVTRVVLANRTTGGGETLARVTPSGRFATTLVAAAGTNRVWARATLSDGETTEREWAFVFDDRLVRERLLAAEREYMQRMREKRLHLRPMWDEEVPPLPEELATPDVAAEPPE
ncbi:MAG: vWA domain-containing protein [Myxococcota bacterium]